MTRRTVRVETVAIDAPHEGTTMGQTTRWISRLAATGVVLLAGCAPGSGSIVPAELDREGAPPSVTDPADASAGGAPPLTDSVIEASTVVEAGSPVDTNSGTGPQPSLTAAPAIGADPAGPDDQPSSGETLPEVRPRFGEGLGTPVLTAPSIRTRGDTRQLLAEGLFVHLAWEPDPADASVFTTQPEDVPILEAYAQAQLAYYRAALGLSTPDDANLDRFFVDGRARFADAFATRIAAGLDLQLGSGVVLRPYVIADQRTTTRAVVLDCYLHDEQEVPRGTDAIPGPLRTYGLVATMVRVDGVWKLERTGTEPGICL